MVDLAERIIPYVACAFIVAGCAIYCHENWKSVKDTYNKITTSGLTRYNRIDTNNTVIVGVGVASLAVAGGYAVKNFVRSRRPIQDPQRGRIVGSSPRAKELRRIQDNGRESEF